MLMHNRLICTGNFVRGDGEQSFCRISRDERAVSEILGTIMLLAMIMTIMGGVWIFLQPYMNDFEDNTNWSAAHGIADRFEDRIEVAAIAPEGSGIRHNFALQSASILPLRQVESWQIQADITSFETVELDRLSTTEFVVEARNETARSIRFTTPIGIEEFNFTTIFGKNTFETTIESDHWMIVDVLDADGLILHRWISWEISGIDIRTNLEQGEHRLALVNGGKAEVFSDNIWEVTYPTDLVIDQMAEGGLRLSVPLNDVILEKGLSSGSRSVDIVSGGQIVAFDQEVWNVKFEMKNSIDAIITPQYHESWLSDYTLNRASGTLAGFQGIAPFERASGFDGFTVETNGESLFLDVSIQTLEVGD